MFFAADLRAGETLMSRRVPAMGREEFAAQIASLLKLDTDELRERWKSVYGKAPSREIGRSFLTRAITYRLQERAGGLKPSTCRLLARPLKRPRMIHRGNPGPAWPNREPS